jgi:hypothetical protein
VEHVPQHHIDKKQERGKSHDGADQDLAAEYHTLVESEKFFQACSLQKIPLPLWEGTKPALSPPVLPWKISNIFR